MSFVVRSDYVPSGQTPTMTAQTPRGSLSQVMRPPRLSLSGSLSQSSQDEEDDDEQQGRCDVLPPSWSSGKPQSPLDPRQREQDLDWRLSVTRALGSALMTVDPCDVATHVHVTSNDDVLALQEKQSVSDTVLVLGQLRIHGLKGSAALKIGFAPRVEKRGYLPPHQYEAEVYHAIVSPLLSLRITPHLFAYIGTFRCDHVDRAIRAWSDKKDTDPETALIACKLAQSIDQIRQSVVGQRIYNFDVMDILALERGSGMDFGSLTDSRQLTSLEYGTVLVQVLYTLCCFAQLGVRQNDLHLGNVWIETPVRPSTSAYFISANTYILLPNQGLFAKVYDFDHASTADTSVLKDGNDLLESNARFCRIAGTCNFAKNTKFDCYMFLYLLYHVDERLPDDLRHWIRDMAKQSPSFLLPPVPPSPWSVSGRLCKKNALGRCDGNYEPSDAEFPPTQEWLIGLAKRMGVLRNRHVHGPPPEDCPTYHFPSVSA